MVEFLLDGNFAIEPNMLDKVWANRRLQIISFMFMARAFKRQHHASFAKYGIELVGDDSDRQRTKYLLYLVTPKVSLPVGFRFYQLQIWQNGKDEKLKGVKKSKCLVKPEPNPAYPNKLELMLALLKEFKFYHSEIKVKAILADALYGNSTFMNQAMAVFTNI